MAELPIIPADKLERFNSEEQEILLQLFTSSFSDYSSVKKWEEMFPVVLETFQKCVLDNKYPQNEDVEYNCRNNFSYFVSALESYSSESKGNLNKVKKFSEPLLRFYFKLLKSGTKEHVGIAYEISGSAYTFISFKGLEEFLKEELPIIIEITRNAGPKDFTSTKTAKEVSTFINWIVIREAAESKGKMSRFMIDYSNACMDRILLPKLEQLKNILSDTKIITWKGNLDDCKEFMKRWKEVPPFYQKVFENDEDDKEAEEEEIDEDSEEQVKYRDTGHDVFNGLISLLEQQNLVKKLSKETGDLLLSCVEKNTRIGCIIGQELPDHINWKEVNYLICNTINAITTTLKRDDFKEIEDQWYNQFALYKAILSPVCQFAQQANDSEKYSGALYDLFDYCMTQDLESDNGYWPISGYGDILRIIMTAFLTGNNNKNACMPFMKHVIKLASCEVEHLPEMAGNVIQALQINPEMLATDITGLIDSFVNTSNFALLSSITSSFNKEDEKIMLKFDEIASQHSAATPANKYIVFQFFSEVAKKYPERVINHKATIINGLEDPSSISYVLMALASLSAHSPQQFTEVVDQISIIVNTQPMYVYYVDSVIVNVGSSDDKQAEKAANILVKQLKKIDSTNALSVLTILKKLADNRPNSLLAHKAFIESYKTNPGPGIKDSVDAIIDVLEGRSLQSVSQKVDETKEDVDQLDNRMTNTEGNIKELDDKVDNQQKDLDTVKVDVKEQGERLDDLEEVVDETIEKVEEIDHKTLSSAPAWSRDVSLLLNPESDSDWRFIAIRLGYSPEDIRNWATAHDPTMSMLSEWYTTHKSSDATYAVLTSLKELGRNDCADVIEKALKDADQAVPGPPPEMTHPPPIFISYQWDHQSEIKAIRTHLEMAGYECWMDIGQMGGGDKLYEKIDEGMRGAKVVLSMCTSKYAQSKNCNHEVNLASLLNKPIIPIILEDMPWPPPGAMSMLFSQLLYIDFKSDQGTEGGEKFWTDAKFSELLGQITYYVAPDPEKIADEYKNWIPKIEEPAAKPKNSSKTNNNTQETKSKTDTSQEPEVVDPEVFISYQWDKQPEVKKLYGKLADLGFTCWLDINQMGGGDALYGKIDKGVRKAKVVVSCVTTKYALSANCRREVSLSDALRKPIIPILLEETAWPPEGPMSMPFAQLLYIDFTRENSQQFSDEKFKELLSKLQEYSEPIKIDVPEKSQGIDKNDPSDSNSNKSIEPKKENKKELDDEKEKIQVLDKKDQQNSSNPKSDQNINSSHYNTTSNSTSPPPTAHNNNPPTNNIPPKQQPAKKSITCNVL